MNRKTSGQKTQGARVDPRIKILARSILLSVAQ